MGVVGLVGGQQMATQMPGLLPQRRGVYVEAVPRHLANLALQGEVIGELRDRHVHGEVNRVAPTGNEFVGAERGLDSGSAP